MSEASCIPIPPIPSTLVDPSIVENPHPVLALLRKHEPLFWDPVIRAWVATRYEDVKAIFSDRRFSRDRTLSSRYVPPPGDSWAYKIDHDTTTRSSGEEHTRWRKRISAGFTPRAVRRMESQVREVVEQFAAPLRGRRGTVDLIARFTNPIPNTVISRITGIPPYPGEEDRFRCLAQDVIRRFFPMADEENVQRGEQAIGELAEWVDKLADQRRREPANDLLSDLITGNLGDDSMSNDEIVMLITVLVAAGSETTTLGGTRAIELLLEHPGQAAKLREDPGLIENAIREVLRFGFGSTVGGTPRVAMEDVELRGKKIEKGQSVMLSTTSANRDEAVFDDPDRFDVTRDTRDMLSFGSGPHYCLGANLAMQEMSCMVEAALDFLPQDATLVEAARKTETIGIMHRPVTLPVDFG
ncbi:MAG: cytochrome P450 [Deltaproteobacteria bacterium]|jgi:cytochrome P450|nr:cytochrome P450 [Deltaproteobacteria bacterium]MBW2496973.1 cytochrome P450 [Deltaproteobacteria bacterium]